MLCLYQHGTHFFFRPPLKYRPKKSIQEPELNKVLSACRKVHSSTLSVANNGALFKILREIIENIGYSWCFQSDQ